MKHFIDVLRLARTIHKIVDPEYRYGYEDDLKEYGFLWHYKERTVT